MPARGDTIYTPLSFPKPDLGYATSSDRESERIIDNQEGSEKKSVRIGGNPTESVVSHYAHVFRDQVLKIRKAQRRQRSSSMLNLVAGNYAYPCHGTKLCRPVQDMEIKSTRLLATEFLTCYEAQRLREIYL